MQQQTSNAAAAAAASSSSPGANGKAAPKHSSTWALSPGALSAFYWPQVLKRSLELNGPADVTLVAVKFVRRANLSGLLDGANYERQAAKFAAALPAPLNESGADDADPPTGTQPAPNEELSLTPRIKMEGADPHLRPFEFTEIPRSRYLIIEKIGEGTYGGVWKASDRRTRRAVALKRLMRNVKPSRIYIEVAILRHLRGLPNVVQLLGGHLRNYTVTLSMEYFDHDDILDYYNKLTWEEVAIYMYQLFTALNGVHQKAIIHRDIKPANCLFKRATGAFCLVDFGLAEYSKRDLYDKLNLPANRAGTRGYRAPEVLWRNPSPSIAIDVWAAGVVLLSLLCGRYPFFISVDPAPSLLEISELTGSAALQDAARQQGFELELPHRPAPSLRPFCGRLRTDNPVAPFDAAPEPLFELLERCLRPDFTLRITAAEALRHPALSGVPQVLARLRQQHAH